MILRRKCFVDDKISAIMLNSVTLMSSVFRTLENYNLSLNNSSEIK